MTIAPRQVWIMGETIKTYPILMAQTWAYHPVSWPRQTAPGIRRRDGVLSLRRDGVMHLVS